MALREAQAMTPREAQAIGEYLQRKLGARLLLVVPAAFTEKADRSGESSDGRSPGSTSHPGARSRQRSTSQPAR
jgi:hypothetical protein